MRRARTWRGSLVVLAAIAATAAAAAAARIEADLGELHIAEAYAKATPPGGRTAGAYLRIDNRGATADALVGARSPVAGAVELHEMREEGGMMRMHAVPRIEIPAHGSVRLAPGGLHLMIFDPKPPLRPEVRFPVTLTFERAGTVELSLPVEPFAGR